MEGGAIVFVHLPDDFRFTRKKCNQFSVMVQKVDGELRTFHSVVGKGLISMSVNETWKAILNPFDDEEGSIVEIYNDNVSLSKKAMDGTLQIIKVKKIIAKFPRELLQIAAKDLVITDVELSLMDGYLNPKQSKKLYQTAFPDDEQMVETLVKAQEQIKEIFLSARGQPVIQYRHNFPLNVGINDLINVYIQGITKEGDSVVLDFALRALYIKDLSHANVWNREVCEQILDSNPHFKIGLPVEVETVEPDSSDDRIGVSLSSVTTVIKPAIKAGSKVLKPITKAGKDLLKKPIVKSVLKRGGIILGNTTEGVLVTGGSTLAGELAGRIANVGKKDKLSVPQPTEETKTEEPAATTQSDEAAELEILGKN